MTERIKVGVIGTGGIAVLRHLPAYKDAEAAGKAEIVAVSDVVEASARQAAATFGVPHAFTDYRELLQLPLDAVSICTPNVSHEPIALAALDARDACALREAARTRLRGRAADDGARRRNRAARRR